MKNKKRIFKLSFLQNERKKENLKSCYEDNFIKTFKPELKPTSAPTTASQIPGDGSTIVDKIFFKK